jgi:uncharacterized membrane protein (UPF0127 family)
MRAPITSPIGRATLVCALPLLSLCKVHAEVQCMPDGEGFLRAKIAGAIKQELRWGNDGTECTGGVRPAGAGLRLTFAHASGDERLRIVFGIAPVAEGASAKALPVNVTLVREGKGEFFGTQGDDKCTLDQVRQEKLPGTRRYRVVGRGFCTEPARSVNGPDSILLSRFDFAGAIDYAADEAPAENRVNTDTLLAPFQRGTLTISTPDARVHRFKIWFATTEPERERGLMFVRDMPADAGMLFQYEDARTISMWMKNTFIPLDMVFMDGAGRVVDVAADAKPQSLDIIASHVPATSVLELNAGTAQRLGIRPGARVTIGDRNARNAR